MENFIETPAYNQIMVVGGIVAVLIVVGGFVNLLFNKKNNSLPKT